LIQSVIGPSDGSHYLGGLISAREVKPAR